MSSPTPTETSSERVSSVANQIESSYQSGQRSSSKLLSEVNSLRQADTSNGTLDKSQYTTDLSTLSTDLHSAKVLPNLDIVDTASGAPTFRGIGSAGETPSGSGDGLVAKSHGTTFTYNKEGEVQSYSKGDTSWKYSSKDGDFHQYVKGKETSKKSDTSVSMGANGMETVTNSDGSTTNISAWGGTIDRNAAGQMTQEVRGKDTKSFSYTDGSLSSMTDTQKGQAAVTYTKDSNGNFYASTDKDKKNPLQISVEPEDDQNGKTENGVVKVTTLKTGDSTDYRWGGTDTNWDKSGHLTSVDYSNGNKASDVTYDNNGNVSGFKMTDKDGKTSTYDSSNGSVSVNGGTGAAGDITVGSQGSITVASNGDGTDSSFKQTHFGLGGDQVDSIKVNSKIVPETVINAAGKTSSFKYDSTGALNSVDAYGYNLEMKNGSWVDATSGKAADVTPSVSTDGGFSITNPNGTYETWSPNGVQVGGIPDTAAGIAAETKAVNAGDSYDGSTSSSNPTATAS